MILHLGLAKTGTSWLQKKVFPLMDVQYYHVGHYDVVGKKTDEKTLFSFEGLSGTPYDDNRYLLADQLKRLFPEAKIVVVFREKESYIKSLYSQYIKGGGVHSYGWFKTYLSNASGFLDWDSYKSYLIGLWGYEQCLFLTFEDFLLDKKRFVQQLCTFFNVPDVSSHVDYTSLNTSLSERQIKVWRLMNTCFKSRWNTQAVLPQWLNPCFFYKTLEGYIE